MRFSFDTQGTNSFLTYSMEPEEKIDSMSMGMVSNNHIEGIIPFQYMQIDDKRFLKYNVSTKTNLTNFFSGVVNRRRLLGIMKSISSIVLDAQEYMLEPSCFVWDKEYIFVDIATTKAQLICLPLETNGVSGNVNLEQFFRQLLLSVSFDQNENCDYVAILLGFFNSNTHFSLQEFNGILTKIDNSPVRLSASQSAPAPLDNCVEMPDAPKLNDNPTTLPLQQTPANQGDNQGTSVVKTMNIPKVSNSVSLEKANKEKKVFSLFGSKDKPGKKVEKKAERKSQKRATAPMAMNIPGIETPLTPIDMPGKEPAPVYPMSIPSLGGEDETEIMTGDETEIVGASQDFMVNAWLELISATQPGAMPRIDLNMNKSVLTIGRISSDEMVPDIAFPSTFKRIGRQHARIERRGSEFYIVDLGSTNHTLLDNQMLMPNQSYKMLDGMELTFTCSKTAQYRVHIQSF